MTLDELKDYGLRRYKEIFGDKYDAKRASESLDKLLKIDKDPDSAKEAIDAIVGRTKAKLAASKNFDDMPNWILKFEDKVIDIKDGVVYVDGVPTDLRIDYNQSLRDNMKTLGDKMEEIKKVESARPKVFDGAVSAIAPATAGVTLEKTKLGPVDYSRLMNLKEYLKTAPAEVKKDYNKVITYLDGKCPETGCIEQDSEGAWRIISNRTGEYWPSHYKSEESAKAALRAYHARG